MITAITIQKGTDMSPLQNAIMQNNYSQVIEILTAFPSSATEVSDNPTLPSHLAAQFGSFEILKDIVEYSRASLDEYDS